MVQGFTVALAAQISNNINMIALLIQSIVKISPNYVPMGFLS